MEINIKKLREDAVIPTYGTIGAACFDLYAERDIAVYPGQMRIVPTGLAMEIPIGYELQIRPRSGVTVNTPIRIGNSPGTIDSDYRGEVGIMVDNISINNYRLPYLIKKGDRIAQGIITPVEKTTFNVVDELSKTERDGNGFGSTGK